MTRMSESTNFVLLPMSGLYRVSGGKCGHVQGFGLVRKHGGADLAQVGFFVILRRLDRAPRRGPDRERELLEASIAIADLPGDHTLFRFPQHSHLVAERRE